MTVDGCEIEAPPLPVTAAGAPRRVGVELEFAGLDAVEAAQIVVELFGGELDVEGPHRAATRGGALGDFEIELDWRGAHEPPQSAAPGVIDVGVEKRVRETLGHAAAMVVPIEIVCPPIAWSRLDALDPLFEALRRSGAKGTEAGVLYGFGLHLNPEIADASVGYALRHLRAYAILEDWLRATIEIDVTRRILPHIDPFPAKYLQLLMDENYEPDMRMLIRDYLGSNPSRNYGLDMAPLFRFLDEDLVLETMGEARLVKARPTFHYRLPNARLSDARWSAVVEWNRWVEVERLAADAERLDERRAAYARWLAKPAHERWIDALGEWFAR